VSTEPPLDVARVAQQDEEVLATTQHGFTFFEVDTYDD